MREPDFCNDYRTRWEQDKKISVNAEPLRFELASFWRLVRDPSYVDFLKELDVKQIQLTFFGLEGLTDQYIGRTGAFQELLQATEILIQNQIAPRWQAFINQENKDELVQLLDLSRELKLKERCQTFGQEFKFFVHAGSCHGENQKLYNIRIRKSDIPAKLIPHYLNYESKLSEKECLEIMLQDDKPFTYHNEKEIVLNITNTFDVYYNFTHNSDEWRIGNLKECESAELVNTIIHENTLALNQSKQISCRELALRYSDVKSDCACFLEDYKAYLLNRYLKDLWLAD